MVQRAPRSWLRVDGQRATLEPVRLGGPAWRDRRRAGPSSADAGRASSDSVRAISSIAASARRWRPSARGAGLTAGGVVWDAARPLVSVKLDADWRPWPRARPRRARAGRGRAVRRRGTVAGTRARARIDGDGLTLPGALARLGKGTSHADLQLGRRRGEHHQGRGRFPGLPARSPGASTSTAGWRSTRGPPRRRRQLGAALGWSNSSGTATATATLRGTLSQPDGQARLASDRLAVAGVAVERLDAVRAPSGRDAAPRAPHRARPRGAPARPRRVDAVRHGTRASWRPARSPSLRSPASPSASPSAARCRCAPRRRRSAAR